MDYVTLMIVHFFFGNLLDSLLINRFLEKLCLVYMLGIWIQGSLSASLKMNFACLELFEGVVYLTSWPTVWFFFLQSVSAGF